MSVSVSEGQTAISSLCIHEDTALRCKIRRSWRRGGRARCSEVGGGTEALSSGIVSDLRSSWSEEFSCEEDDCRRGGGEKIAMARRGGLGGRRDGKIQCSPEEWEPGRLCVLSDGGEREAEGV
ncbi:hypothetical protein J3459_010645 [Metarhizium acridum]|nr:hypothetical protein J3459_010645 [Metarhizium acridum]